MNCFTCNKKLESSMSHALSINSCPFCGMGVFTPEEHGFRKSIQKILIKNNVDDESQASKIVDDISTALRDNFMETTKTSVAVAKEETDEETDEEEEVTLSPRDTTKASPKKEESGYNIDDAMRAFEDSQRLDDGVEPEEGETDGVYMPTEEDERVARLKAKNAANLKRIEENRPDTAKKKSRPISRVES